MSGVPDFSQAAIHDAPVPAALVVGASAVAHTLKGIEVPWQRGA